MGAIFKHMKLSSDRKGVSHSTCWNRANGSVQRLQQLDIEKKLILLPRKAERLLFGFITSYNMVFEVVLCAEQRDGPNEFPLSCFLSCYFSRVIYTQNL